jgi:hypothetical protein
LAGDRLLRIVLIGKDGVGNALYATASLLYSASEMLKAAWYGKEVSLGQHYGVEFHDADYEVWEVLLYWLLKRKLPQQIRRDQMLLVRCWVLGEDLAIQYFMADIMFRLLRYFNKEGSLVTIAAAKYAFCKTRRNVLVAGNPLFGMDKTIRLLFAEELIKSGLVDYPYTLPERGLDICDEGHEDCGLAELPDLLMLARQFYDKYPTLLTHRFILGHPGRAAEWMQRMDGDKWHNITKLVEVRIQYLLAYKEQHE